MTQFRKVFFVLVGAIFAIMFIQNVSMFGERLEFHFFTMEPVQLMAGYWFMIFAAFGLTLGAFFSMRSYWVHQKAIKALKAEIKHLNEELAQHRTLGLDDEPGTPASEELIIAQEGTPASNKEA